MKQFSRHDIELQLERILKGEDFQRSQRMSSFLEYVVSRTLDDKKDRISGYSIGVDVFSKPEGFNADNDSSVRVEAVRLRKALELYYHTTGKNDPIIIKVPKGGYVPFFIENADRARAESHSSLGRIRGGAKASHMWLAGGVAAILTLFFGVLFISTITDLHVDILEKPVLAMEPFGVFGFDNPEEIQAKAAYAFHNRFSHFSTLQNVSVKDKEGLETLRSKKAHDKFHYLLEGKMENVDGFIRVKMRLSDTRQRTSVWTYTKTYMNDDDWIDDVASLVVSQLASTHGVIDTLEYGKFHQEKVETGREYKCLLSFRMYDNNKSILRHAKVRDCLERLVKDEPNNSLAWAYLSLVYGDEVRQAYNTGADGYEGAKRRSLEAGIKAVEADQKSALAHSYLSTAAMLNGNLDLTRRHINLSVALNPYDTMILIQAAWKLMNFGEWENGKAYAERAYRLHPSPPPMFDGPLFSYHYMNENYEKALFFAMGYYLPELFTSNLTLIAAYQRTDKPEEAEKLAKSVNKQYPEQLKNFYSLAASWHIPKEYEEKLLEDLKAAGVNIPER